MSSHTRSPSTLSFGFVVTLLVVIPTLASAEWILPKKGSVNLDGFLVVACAQTWYPEVCYDSLSPFVDVTEKAPGHLALIALDQAVKETQQFIARLPSLSDSLSGPAKIAVDGFLKIVTDNGAKIQGSLTKLQKVVGGKPGASFEDTMVAIEKDLRTSVSTVTSWADKLEAAGNSETCQAIKSLKYTITNAWNLVVFYFNDETSPTFT
ncbi:hypothetical protein MLD38_003868 [Melastoma candidum]|uniref:Uncharacterized protein n=1 Tax=Melastoma candidum TaxID=119954 RepID=A0ACB9S4M2_9MYRT|nr:hypothetical protein MLD38_003868 [Melastoma candidum]